MPSRLTPSPAVRNGLRLFLAAALTIAMVLWCGRSHTLLVGLITVVLFTNDTQTKPLQSLLLFIASILIGCVVGLVLYPLSDSWLMLSLALLVSAALVRLLRLAPGLPVAYLGCWAALVLRQGQRFEIGVVFDLVLPALIGMLAALFATWLVWPPRSLRRLQELDERLIARVQLQQQRLEGWFAAAGGGPPPVPLRSSELLPAIDELQRLAQGSGHGWTQLSLLWRQLLTQWLLLEPLLLAMPPQLAQTLQDSLLQNLKRLRGDAGTPAQKPAPASLQAPADASMAMRLALQAVAVQLDHLAAMGRSQQLLRRALQQGRLRQP
ncbi:MAG: hypothetical protein ACO289_09835 [Prochlorococcaceae cyanobacterium]